MRKDLFDILRTKGTPAYRFEGSLKAYRNWAFFSGATVDGKGSAIKHPPMENSDAAALWLRTADGWKLVEHSFGHSDVFWFIWKEKYGAPGELLGVPPEE